MNTFGENEIDFKMCTRVLLALSAKIHKKKCYSWYKCKQWYSKTICQQILTNIESTQFKSETA